MAADETASGGARSNLLETLLEDVRERYVEEHGEEPPAGIYARRTPGHSSIVGEKGT